jgi:GNAT superfamily N-acetyltransferase
MVDPDPFILSVEDQPSAEDAIYVRGKLSEYNREHVGAQPEHRELCVFLRDRQGAIFAGLLGDTYWGWLHVGILWVDKSVRGQGYGSRLLEEAERQALARGCHHAHLDTMSFQALPFYQKRGYTVWGELTDMPHGHRRHFLQKALI